MRIYGPPTWDRRGGTIAFNFLHPDGRPVDERYVDRIATQHRVSVRTGCFCNPGAGEVAFSLPPQRLATVGLGRCASLDDYLARIGMPTGGAVRASLGLASNTADVHGFLAFAAEFRDLTSVPERPSAATRLLTPSPRCQAPPAATGVPKVPGTGAFSVRDAEAPPAVDHDLLAGDVLRGGTGQEQR